MKTANSNGRWGRRLLPSAWVTRAYPLCLLRTVGLGWHGLGILFAVGLLLYLAAEVGAQDKPAPPGSGPAAQPDAKPAAAQKPTSSKRTVKFQMQDKPWDKVLEWLADSFDVHISSNYKPKGTFNFIGNPERSYTLPEVLDILNEALIVQKFVMIRRPNNSIIIVPADEPIDPSLINRITLDDLEVDKPPSEQKYGRTELAQVIFPLDGIAADEATKAIEHSLGPFKKVEVISQGTRLLVTDTVGNLRRAKAMLDELRGTSTDLDVAVIRLGFLDGASTLDTLQSLFGSTGQPPRPGAPSFRLDQQRNAIIVRGTPAQIKEVQRVVHKLGGPAEGAGTPGAPAGGAGTDHVRILTLSPTQVRGGASAVIDALVQLWPTLRANPIEVVTQSQVLPRLEAARKRAPTSVPAPESPKRSPGPGTRLGQPEAYDVRTVAQAQPAQPGRPATARLPGNPNQPVIVAPLVNGNGIIIACDDAETLLFVEEVVRYLTAPGEGDYVVIPIRYASAEEVARRLDELFNGRQQGQRGIGFPFAFMMGGQGGFGGPGAGRGDGTQSPSAPVRIVADPRTNSILVRAPKLELLTIRRLLETALDVEEADAAALTRVYIIGPLQNANATDVAAVLREVFRDYMTSNRGPGGFPGASFGGFPFGAFAALRRDANNERPSGRGTGTLSIGVDERTNSLVVSCPEPLYEQIRRLVEELDKQASQSNRTVRVVRVNNVDPELLQRAVEAITGQRRDRTRATTSFPGSTPGATTPFGAPTDDRQREQMREEFRRRFLERFGQPGAFPGAPGSFPGGGFPGGPGGGFRGGDGTRGFPRSGGGPPPEGPDFFDHGVTDDPHAATLRDSRSTSSDLGADRASDPGWPADWHVVPAGGSAEPGRVLPAAAPEAPQQPTGQQTAPPTQQPVQPAPQEIRAPRRPVSIEAFPEIGQIVIIGEPADVEEVVRIIEQIAKIAAPAETDIQIFRLHHADAASVTATLTQLYQRLIVTAGATTRAPTGQQLQQASVILLPLARLNAILVGAPRARIKEIEDTIRKLDQPLAADTRLRTYPLQRANATRVATTLQQFYAQRYPNETAAQNIVRIQAEEKTNTILVQAGPADQEEIARLIEYVDRNAPSAVNEVRIVPLRHAIATDLANILQQAISEGVAPAAPTAPAQPPGVPGVPVFGQQAQARPGAQAGAARSATLRFVTRRPDGKALEADLLEEVRVTADVRTNALLVSAPPDSIELILALIRELDVPPAAVAEVKVFRLRKADATAMVQMLYQIFYGVLGFPGTRPGVGAQPGGAALPGQLGTLGQLGGLQRTPLTLGATTAEGAPLVELRFAVDVRTNSVIVAGSRGDLLIVEALILRLDQEDVRERKTEVYRLRNTAAEDVFNAVNSFLQTEQQRLQALGEITQYQQLEREVIIVPEPVSNALIISATPRYFPEVMRIIEGIDAEPPQVVIQVLIAEVQLTDSEEFGVEAGLQSPILFRRSLVSGGVVVNNVSNIGAPGFNFNSLGPLPNSSFVDPGVVAHQGLTNFSMGRASPTGIGGFVFSASSESFNLLIRALKTQGKLDVLSRPQIMTLDNQTAFIQVGQNVPYVTASVVNVAGGITNTVNFQQVGVILQVTPKISPDGHVIMRVEPQVSSLAPSTVNLGNNVFAPIFNVTLASTTISAADGQTVAIAGLITRRDDKQERKVPWLGDIPYVGAAFRFRTHARQKNELLIVLTPRVVRNRAEAERVLAEEARKMDWALGEVTEIHGALDVPLPGALPPHPGEVHVPLFDDMWKTTVPPEGPELEPAPTPRQMPKDQAPGKPPERPVPSPQPPAPPQTDAPLDTSGVTRYDAAGAPAPPTDGTQMHPHMPEPSRGHRLLTPLRRLTGRGRD